MRRRYQLSIEAAAISCAATFLVCVIRVNWQPRLCPVVNMTDALREVAIHAEVSGAGPGQVLASTSSQVGDRVDLQKVRLTPFGVMIAEVGK